MEQLNHKITLAFAAFGAFLSLILSLFHTTDPLHLLFRMLISAFILGGLVVIGQLLIFKFVSEEDLQILFPKDNNIPNQEPETPPAGSKIDVSDDSSMSAEELYSTHPEYEENTETPQTHISPSTSNNISDTINDESIPTEPAGFQNTDFSEEAPHINETTASINDEIVSQELNRLKENAASPVNSGPFRPSNLSVERDVSFTVDNKKINVDPKIIAKAIRTVLNKDD